MLSLLNFIIDTDKEGCESGSSSSSQSNAQRSFIPTGNASTSRSAKRTRLSRPFLSTVFSSRPPSVGFSKVLEEFDVNLNEPMAVDSEGYCDLSFSPVSYLKANVFRYPILAPIAKDFLGVPASSANIERLFSTALEILPAKRNKMKSNMFEMLLFIKKNSTFLANLKNLVDLKISSNPAKLSPSSDCSEQQTKDNPTSDNNEKQ